MDLRSRFSATLNLELTPEQLAIFESLFDPRYYFASQPDVAQSGVDAGEHYLHFGWREGRNPSERFDTIWYLHTYEDAARSGINPLVHYARIAAQEDRRVSPEETTESNWRAEAAGNEALPPQMRAYLATYNKVLYSGLFDVAFYRETYSVELGDPIECFIRHGSSRGHAPNSKFDPAWYRSNYADVRSSDLDPFIHYIEFGVSEGRQPGPNHSGSIGVKSAMTLVFGHSEADGGSIGVVLTDESASRGVGAILSPGERAIFDSLFDSAYYYASQPDVASSGMAADEHYLHYGWREGRNPSQRFNTVWYLHAYEDAARSGLNPLVHYARFGVQESRRVAPDEDIEPNWRGEAAENEALPPELRAYLATYNKVLHSGLFDEDFYRAEYSIEQGDPLECFLRGGSAEERAPNSYFDPEWYRNHNEDVKAGGLNPFLHYVDSGFYEGRPTGPGGLSEPLDEEIPATILALAEGAPLEDVAKLVAEFDEAFYRDTNPDIVFDEVSPLEHFCRLGWREGRDPSPVFCVKGYFHHNPDVLEAGINPFLHYVVVGRSEGRISRPLPRPPRAADGRSEWLGYAEVRGFGGESQEGGARDMSALEFCQDFSDLDLVEVIEKIDLSASKEGDPFVSIVIPCLNEASVTVECLASIEKAMPKDFGVEVIIIDNASTDPAYAAIAKNPTLRCHRFEKNIGFGPACNAGARMARGQFVFFLNNDAQISPGCLEALINAAAREDVGLVGPKILSFDGTLQEAGCLLNSDGTGELIGFGRDHRTPRYNYARAVEHVSGAAILIRRALFEELGGFDDVFAPAYCEDADLSMKIRQRGLRILYEPKGVIAHHLSKTSNSGSVEHQSKRQRISRNRNVLIRRWADELARKELRTIAFYLPQYHPIPENDLWWGKGFTEWTNVAKAAPNYVGHNQPRVPADLGYYDLRVPEIMEQQAELARRYGVTGFCYYYYWFDGKRLLEHPIERMLASGKPDFPFCLCWANENWTRRWDGKENDVLLGQSYTEEGAVEIIADLARYFRSAAYIRIGGRPLVLIYRIKDLPEPRRMMETWRHYCRQNGLGEICIAMVESFQFSAMPEDPRGYGCDITVEFPAHGMVHDPAKEVSKLNFDWTGSVHDYRLLAGAFMKRVEAGFPRIRSVLAGWDNTPRHPTKSLILDNATPGAFQAWLEWTYRRTLEQNYGDERLVFILAWNEWCEGSYLEPDRHFGHAYLQAVRNALDAAQTGRDAFVV